MFAIIKNWKLSGFTDVKITKENMDFDKLIEWDFNLSWTYDFIDWELVEKVETKEEKIQKINSETREKILSQYSETDQTNLERKASRIMWVVLYEKRDFTVDELVILDEVMKADDFINACIAEWNEKINSL